MVMATATGARPVPKPPNDFQRTALGLIPSDWRVHKLGELFDITAGGDLVRRDFSPLEDEKFCFPIYANALRKHGLYGFSKSLGYSGGKLTVTARGDIGHAEYRKAPFCAIGRLLVLSPRMPCSLKIVSEQINNFVEFALESTGVPQLTAPQIAKYEIALPSTEREQEAIAEALSDADALIESLEALIAKKRAIKQAAMRELLSERMRMPSFGGEWTIKKFGNLAAVRNQKVNTLANPLASFCVELENLDSTSGRLLASSDATDRVSSKYSFRKRDVLFGRLRPYLRKFWQADRDGVSSTEIWPLIPVNDGLDPDYLYQIVQTESFIEAASSSYGTHMPRSDWKALQQHEIALPIDTNEQQAIARLLSDMDSEVASIEAKAVKARQIKHGMMQELLTGRVRLI